MPNKPPPDQSNSRNEYIPSYITKAPFYAEGLSDGDYLEHQRLQATPKDTLDKAKWYERGRKTGPASTKFRKGACENCGAMSHKTKECLERPRKHGAKWTGRDIQADEVLADVNLGWNAKRDRWNGYDAREYSAVVKEYEDMEQLRQSATSSNAKISDNKNETGDDEDDDDDDEEDNAGSKSAEKTDKGRSQPKSSRQLRIREDTANYLLNLDLDSAQYNPKTRHMDTTAQDLAKGGISDSIAEEGFVRPSATSTTTDEAAAFERAQRYAWETQESGNKSAHAKMLHLQANPTEGEILLKKKTDESAAKKQAHRQALIAKYGDQPRLQPTLPSPSSASNPSDIHSRSKPPKAIAATESYVEYDKHGNIKPPANQPKPVARSKYREDMYTNNHTSVFGSFWAAFQWGYACCHSTVKNSYCTGDAGKAAFKEAEGLRMGHTLLEGTMDQGDDVDKENVHQLVQGDKGKELKRSEREGTAEQIRGDETGTDTDVVAIQPGKKSNKRAFGDSQSGVTEEELEAYKRSKVAADDPMRAWGKVGDDGLLEHGPVS